MDTDTDTDTDNEIIKCEGPDPGTGTGIGTGIDTDIEYYKFKQPYEINIDDCLIATILATSPSSYVLHIDITGTDAQQTLSDFVTDIAHRVGLDKTITISNMALDFEPETVPIMASEDELQDIIQNPTVLEGLHVNVVIEWDTFHVQVQEGNLGVSLHLTEITLQEPLPYDADEHPYAHEPIDIMDVIRETSQTIIPPERAPELYKVSETCSLKFKLMCSTN